MCECVRKYLKKKIKGTVCWQWSLPPSELQGRASGRGKQGEGRVLYFSSSLSVLFKIYLNKHVETSWTTSSGEKTNTRTPQHTHMVKISSRLLQRDISLL